VQPLDLLKTAETLLKGQARPLEANLRRAQSSLYYAMFHCLAKTCADLFIGGSGSKRSNPAWQQTYRSLFHRETKNACKKGEMIANFPDAIRDFANLFVAMQAKRHSADYDPFFTLTKSEVKADAEQVKQAIVDFRTAPIKHRRAFCAWVMMKPPRVD
jgi:hypothetical protein